MLGGQGVCVVSPGRSQKDDGAAEQMKQANLDTNVIHFTMWTIENCAEFRKGNVIFLDGSSQGWK